MILNRISIGIRVMVGYLLVSLLLLGVAFYGFWAVDQEVAPSMENVVAAHESRVAITESERLLSDAQRDVKAVLLAHRKEDVELAQKRISQAYSALDKRISGQKEKAALKAWKANVDAVVVKMLDGFRLDAEDLAQAQVEEQVRVLRRSLKERITASDEQFAGQTAEASIDDKLEVATPYLVALLVVWLVGLGLLRLMSIGASAASPEEESSSPASPELTNVVQSHSEALSAASYALAKTAEQQREVISSQAVVVVNTQNTLKTLMSSASEVAEVSQRVYNNAESSQHNAQAVADAVHKLGTHATALSELVSALKEIGNRSDLLALNASLEGAKAGPIGRRFAMIGARMERLSGQIMDSAKGMEGLSSEIVAAADSSRANTEEALTLSKDNTVAAQRFSSVVQQQRDGAEGILGTLSELSAKTEGSLNSAHQVVAASERVGELAEELNRTLLSLDA